MTSSPDRARFSAYTAKYRQRKRWAGLCIEHGCWEVADGPCHCSEHKRIHTEKAREYRARQKAKWSEMYPDELAS